MTHKILQKIVTDLTSSEKNKIEKYLKVFFKNDLKNYPLIIFKLYCSIKVYDEKIFKLKSKCNSMKTFQTYEKLVFERIIEFFKLTSKEFKEHHFSKWRAEIDKGVVLRIKGEKYWGEAINFLSSTISETNIQNASATTLTAIDEISIMYPYIMKTDIPKVQKYLQIEKENIIQLNFESKLADFSSHILTKLRQSKILKDEDDYKFIKEIRTNEHFKLDPNSIKNTYAKLYYLLAMLSFSFLTNDFKQLKFFADSLIKNLSLIDKKAWYYNSEIIRNFETSLLQFFYYNLDFKNLEIYLKKYKKTLNHEESNKNKLIDYISRYHQFNLELLMHNDELTYKRLEEIISFKELNQKKITHSVYHILNFTLIKGLYKYKKYEKAYSIANETYQIAIKTDMSSSLVEITKLIELALLFNLFIKEKIDIRKTKRIQMIASSHYNYYIRQKNEYYLFGKEICSFMKSLDLKIKKGLKPELNKLRTKLIEIEKKDDLGNIYKINNYYFNFQTWINETINILD